MTFSLKPTHLKRYKDIAVLLMKYGRGDLANRLDVEGDLPKAPAGAEPSATAKSEELARDLERTSAWSGGSRRRCRRTS